VAQYHQYFQRNNDRVGGKMIELDPFPRIFLVPGLGLLTAGRSTKECNISADIYVQTVPVILNCYTLIDRYVPVPEER
jgi:rhamnose utilization protein RhaD (predicted bifunctional aldolase and dehydrogenase)